jgi:ectoine hydroxylase-related dioxygenase (phytanoyl-CoA dioxygenase family)
MIPAYIKLKKELNDKGFIVINNVFDNHAIDGIKNIIIGQFSKKEMLPSKDTYAIRKLIQEIPALKNKLFIPPVRDIMVNLFSKDYFMVKSIYFDKPPFSNWFVAYHQDLSIAVDRKFPVEGYTNWTIKEGEFGVQPPEEIISRVYTIRLHLDDCSPKNGALHVIPGSHKKGICRPENIKKENEIICEVPAGGIMIMHPLLLHASHKSREEKQRRVVHLEFCNQPLAEPLHWAQKEIIFEN